jgi:chemotaxis protein methyltransferase CheR
MALFPTSGANPGKFTIGSNSGSTPGVRTGVAGSGGLAGRRPSGSLAGLAPQPLLAGAAAGGVGSKVRVSDDEFLQLRDFIYAQSGIFIAEARKYLVENRLNNRIKTLNLKNFGEYYYYLRFDPNRREELTKLFEVITTNETSFWRNPPQLQIFQENVLKGELEKLRRSGRKKLRIWSAGCSTGEEPYTLAIILHEVLKNEIATWDIKITANDLSEAVLTAARKGVYTAYALRTTPQDITARYFIKDGSNYQIDPKMKRLISFGPINLSDKMMLRRVERSNIIFCRNVIIYFDEEMKRQVIESFYDNLLPGGCMLIGHSESLHNISRAFKPEYNAGTIVYRKEA